MSDISVMHEKAEENYSCAEHALKEGWYNAGMSRCYYSIFQNIRHFFSKLVELNVMTKEEYKKYENDKSHGNAIEYLRKYISDEVIRYYRNAMRFRHIADYERDVIWEERLEEQLEKAEIVKKATLLVLEKYKDDR